MYSLKYVFAKCVKKIMHPVAINHSNIDKTARCDTGCIVSYSTMGKYSYIGEFTSLSLVEVGCFTSISSNCVIGGGGHPLDWVSTSPVFTNTRGIMKKKLAKLDYAAHVTTGIGNDVWIGSNCLIKGGIRIADGAVIGMGSVVTHDVGPYEIWAGNPARLIRKRFSDEVINQLLESKWWENDDEILKAYAEFIPMPEEFIRKIKS